MQVPCAYRKIIFYICGWKSQHHTLGAGKLGAAASSGGAVSAGAAAGFFFFFFLGNVGYRSMNADRRLAAEGLDWYSNFAASSLPTNLRFNTWRSRSVRFSYLLTFWRTTLCSSRYLSKTLSSAPASSNTCMQLNLLNLVAYMRAVLPFLHLASTSHPYLSSSFAAFAEPF